MAKRKFRSIRKRRGSFRKSRSLPKRVKRVERSIKKINRSIETKYLDSTLNTSTFSWNAGVTNAAFIGNPAQGTGQSQRIGDGIKLTSLYFRYSLLYSPTGASETPVWARVILVIDKTPATAGTAPNYTDIFESPAVAPGTFNIHLQTPINWANRHRFRIIYDKLHFLPGYGTNQAPTTAVFNWSSGNAEPISGKKRIKLGINTTFSAGTQNIKKNALLLFWQTAATATVTPYIGYYIRAKYRDA